MLSRCPTTTRLLAAATVASGIAATSPFSVAALQAESYTISGSTVSVYNLAGSADVVSTPGGQVVVEVVRGGSDAADLNVEVDQIGGRETLRIVYPEGDIHYAGISGRTRTDIRVNDDGRFGDGSRRRVRVSTTGGDVEAWADLRILMPVGSDVEVNVGLGEISAEGVDGRLVLDTGSGEIWATRVAGEISLDTGSGRIELEDAQGNVTVDTGSGSVVARGISGPRVSLDTGSGSIDAVGVDTEVLFVDTGSGRIELDDISAREILVDSGSGSVDLVLTTDFDELVIDTGSGSVDLEVPSTISARVSVETGSGGIDTEIPLQVRTARRNRLEGTFGDGAGRLEIETGSGSVRIREN